MADFLNDYSGLAAAGSAFEGFAKGWSDAEDRKMKRIEQQANLEALKTKMDREKAQTQLDEYKAHVAQKPGGGYEEVPLSARERVKEEADLFSKGGKAEYDESGNPVPGSIKYDPSTLKAKEAEAKIALGQANLGFKQSAADSRNVKNEMQANKQYSAEMGGTEKQLLNANKVLRLVDDIESGKLQSTPQLRSDLSAGLGSLINQGQPATVFSMSHQDFDSAYGRLQKVFQFASGTTGNSMTKAQLHQLKLDVTALQNEFALQHQAKWEALREGLPSQFSEKLNNRFEKFRKGSHVQDNDNQEGAQGLVPKPPGLVGGGLVRGPGTDQKPQTIKQNGITYNLNPQTGEYE